MAARCPQGTMYTYQEALAAYGAALRRGDTVNGMRQCIECRSWHLGQRRDPKTLEQRCAPAGKRAFATEREAVDELKKVRAARASGNHRRTERFHYRCQFLSGCHGWHLTSSERGEHERE